MSASWYDVLGVDEAATPEQIRTAWKDSIAELSPGDRKFRVCNEAAEVLLDPERRAAYDADIGAAPAAAAPTEPAADDVAAEEAAVAEGTDGTDDKTEDAPVQTTPRAARSLPTVPGWLLIALTVAVLAVASVAGYLQFVGADDQKVETAVDEATSAARTTVPLVLSYDYKNAEAGRDRALKVLTGDLKTDYAELWEKTLIANVVKAKAFARSEVVNAGVACVSDDGRRVGVLVVVDATTGNVKQSNDLTISFTATMEEVDGQWLVANLDGWDPRALTGDEGGSGSPSPSEGSSDASPDAGSGGVGDDSGVTDCAAG